MTIRRENESYRVEVTQVLRITPEQAWAFYANPYNIKRVTPPSFKLKIVNQLLQRKIYTGQIITFKIKIGWFFSTTWKCEIIQIWQGKFFIQALRKGPLKNWVHELHLKKVEQGTEITDIITYQAKGGWLSKLINRWVIEPMLYRFLDYRKKTIEKIFVAY